MREQVRKFGWTAVGLVLVPFVMAQSPAPQAPGTQARGEPPAAKPQTRPHGQRRRVDPAAVTVEDGDGVIIRWSDADTEIVRILGIDTPEIRRLEHDLPYDQPLGPEAKAFAQGAFAAATDVELLRAPTLDPYGRTLAYLFVNGRNFSVLAIKAGFTTETVSHYGDNGLPREAAEVQAAAKAATAPLVFEPPHQFRGRMRALSTWLKQNGQYPKN
ncbi:MAG TPA: thermonuclease family protein [Isosphaeraceae bacterium]|nr:thermonuclease family protein [Isosphaeraceae bacterium]